MAWACSLLDTFRGSRAPVDGDGVIPLCAAFTHESPRVRLVAAVWLVSGATVIVGHRVELVFDAAGLHVLLMKLARWRVRSKVRTERLRCIRPSIIRTLGKKRK